MPIGRTLKRLQAEDDQGVARLISPNVLINPSFVHVKWGEDSGDLNTLAGWDPTWLLYSPGWFPFGATNGTGLEGLIGAATLAQQPFFPNSAATIQGVRITAKQNKVFGLVQQIPVGEALKGRRVRISGMYRPAAGQESFVGISLFLKSSKSSANVTNAGGDWASTGGRGYTKYRVPDSLKHPLAVVAQGEDYNSGHQLLVRCFDEVNDDTTDRFIKMNSPAAASNGVVFRDDLTVYYLNDGLSGTPATDGSHELYSEGDGTATAHYFEQIVEIPTNSQLFTESECWLVVMPVRPTDVASMTQDAEIDLFMLSLEVVLDDATAPDRVLAGLLGSNGFSLPAGLGEGGFRERYLMKNPIYVLEHSPLRVFGVEGRFPLSASPTGDLEMHEYGPGGGGENQLRLKTSNNAPELFMAQDVPWGSSILRAGFSMERDSGTGSLSSIQLRQVLSYPVVAGANGYALRRTQKIIEWAASNTTQFYETGAYRNRVGDYWPDQVTLIDPVDLTDGTNGTAEVVFSLLVSGTAVFYINTGYIVYLVDPRMRGGYFKRLP